MKFLFFGMGYSSQAAARVIQSSHDGSVSISGTVRSAKKASALASDNIAAHIFDGQTPGDTLGEALPGITHLVHSIAPDGDGDAVLNHHLPDLDRATELQWLCYYSTVGVYGNFDGAWITENAACAPINMRSQQRLKAEQQWRDYATSRGLPLTILRLAGIYGPGRSAFDKLEAGTALRIIKPGQVFNRIHVDDIAKVTAAAARIKLDGTFNLTDDEPAPPQDLVSFAADMAGLALPPEVPFADADMTGMARSFYNDNKRVSNAAIKKALGVELTYPTYRDGLSAIYGNM